MSTRPANEDQATTRRRIDPDLGAHDSRRGRRLAPDTSADPAGGAASSRRLSVVTGDDGHLTVGSGSIAADLKKRDPAAD